ncbi:hypothetical protein UFOVP184_8 [uncultured Caudovirales phage]|uniref:Uncharacterized protein n=1 Tax=uncultured Caudovirales phage TaxID=2100421 RepID=A0A6J7WFL8_9CAUD|nr:hypothetical protein UFOVP184_8 [uncultured Caudovirales phage]
MMFILKANKHYNGYDLQVELDGYQTREAAEAEANRLENQLYIHDECEVRRATYVIIEDRTDVKRERSVPAIDGNGKKNEQPRRGKRKAASVDGDTTG